MPWVRDGIGGNAYSIDGASYSTPYSLEHSSVSKLVNLAVDSQQVFNALVQKPWLQDSLTVFENTAIERIVTIANAHVSQSTVRAIVDMPFIDSIDLGDIATLTILKNLSEGQSLTRFLSRQELRDGITDEKRGVARLLSLEFLDRVAAEAIKRIPWVQDGVSEMESIRIQYLHRLYRASEPVFRALAQKPWIRDSLTDDELRLILQLWLIADEERRANGDELARRIVGMPFLEFFEAADASAMLALRELLDAPNQSYLEQVLSHPRSSGDH